ncbi:hypothetical protein BC828DRAFT_401771 [Blastocladiella britannica]|nr:hypothetical protein BC828DRAFT_401771 [Blastocladiella britannica]
MATALEKQHRKSHLASLTALRRRGTLAIATAARNAHTAIPSPVPVPDPELAELLTKADTWTSRLGSPTADKTPPALARYAEEYLTTTRARLAAAHRARSDAWDQVLSLKLELPDLQPAADAAARDVAENLRAHVEAIQAQTDAAIRSTTTQNNQ